MLVDIIETGIKLDESIYLRCCTFLLERESQFGTLKMVYVDLNGYEHYEHDVLIVTSTLEVIYAHVKSMYSLENMFHSVYIQYKNEFWEYICNEFRMVSHETFIKQYNLYYSSN